MKKLEELTDESLMPFGKYKGVPLEHVPAAYLLYLRGEMLKKQKDTIQVFQYVEDNIDELEKETSDE